MPISTSRGSVVATPLPEPAPHYASQQDAAARWQVSVDVIRRLIAAGKITGYRLNNRIIRVDVAEVDAAFRPIPTAGNAA